MADICRFLNFDEAASAKLKQKAAAFFADESLLSPLAVAQTVTLEMLDSAKLRVLWVYIEDLKVKMGCATPCETESLTMSAKKAKATSQDKLATRKEKLLNKWESLGNERETLVLSDALDHFRCTICTNTASWNALRGPSDLVRHCIGGPSSAKSTFTPKESQHARLIRIANSKDINLKKRAREDFKRDKESVEQEDESRNVAPRPTATPMVVPPTGTLMVVPNQLPTEILDRRVEPDGNLAYKCKFSGQRQLQFFALDRLVQKFGKRVVDLVEFFDFENGVDLKIEKLLDQRQSDGRYLVRWDGYPSVFNSWEAYDNLGECADELVEQFEKEEDEA